MDLNQYTITKGKPYFVVPIQEGKEGIILTQFKPDQFNPSDELKVMIKKEFTDDSQESSPEYLMDFKEEFVNGKKLISFTNEHDNKYILITIFIGKTTESGKFIELEKLDPDKIGDFKIHVEYKFVKELAKV